MVHLSPGAPACGRAAIGHSFRFAGRAAWESGLSAVFSTHIVMQGGSEADQLLKQQQH